MVWGGLFVDRLPVSEACRGVCTVLTKLGLGDAMRARDLAPIRAWFAAQDPAEHCERVFRDAGVRCATCPQHKPPAATKQPQFAATA